MVVVSGLQVVAQPKSYFYAANFGDNNGGSITAYAVNPALSTLTQVQQIPRAGLHPNSIVADATGSYVYATYYNTSPGAGILAGFSVNPTSGVLTQLTGSPFAKTLSGPIQVAIDPFGRFVYVADQGDGNADSSAGITTFVRNATTGALTAGKRSVAGTSPVAVAVDPTGRYVYSADFAGPTPSAFTIDPVAGSLTALSRGVAPTFACGTAVVNPQSLVVDPTGRFVYVAYNGGAVAAYRILSTGALSYLQDLCLPSYGPTDVTTDPAGQLLTVSVSPATFGQPGEVATYTIDPATGRLTSTGQTSYGAPYEMCFDYTGKLAFATDLLSGGVNVFQSAAGKLTLLPNAFILADIGTLGAALAAPGSPGLSVTATHTGAFQQGGGGNSLVLTVKNAGYSPTAPPVVVTDTLDANLTFVSTSAAGWSCTTSGKTVKCQRSDSLAPGAVYGPITIKVGVSSSAPASVANTVAAGFVAGSSVFSSTSGADTIKIAPAAPLSVVAPSLTLTLTVKSGAQSARTWTLTVKNTSPSTSSTHTALSTFALAQTTGASCTPIVRSPKPLPAAIGTVVAGASANIAVGLDFTGCAVGTRFTLTAAATADNGGKAALTLTNQTL
jgi:6-phosphogluconolactonase (cycloisomerase 2 family)